RLELERVVANIVAGEQSQHDDVRRELPYGLEGKKLLCRAIAVHAKVQDFHLLLRRGWDGRFASAQPSRENRRKRFLLDYSRTLGVGVTDDGDAQGPPCFRKRDVGATKPVSVNLEIRSHLLPLPSSCLRPKLPA